MAKKRSKASAAQKARLKALRRKHGLGEFKTSSSRKTHSRKPTMAKKKKFSRKSGAMAALMKVVVGGFIYGVARQPLSNITKGFLGGMSDEVGMLLVSGVIANFTSGQIRNAALIGAGIEASALAKNFNIGGIGGGNGGGSGSDGGAEI